MHQEYPKWIRHPGQPDVLVDGPDAEKAQLEAWAALAPKPQVNRLIQLDHDHNGSPGGALKPAGDLADLRAAYKAKFGKKPFAGWGADELKARIGAA